MLCSANTLMRKVITVQRGLAGFVGGLIGGLAMLIWDQITFATNISNVNSVGIMSRFLGGGISPVAAWLIGILITGVVGWLVAIIFSKEFPREYISSGLILGLILWVAMNIIFAAIGTITPTWSMGVSSLIVNLIAHLLTGVIITYTLWRTKVEVVQN